MLPAQAGTNLLSIARAPQTSVPTGRLTSDAQAYGHRWSWQTLTGATGTFLPSAQTLSEKYAPQLIDVSTVPQFAAYTVTFYDASGAQIGQTSVVNPTPNNGANIPWQTLSASTINSLLSPSGSQAGARLSLAMSWSNRVNGVNVAPLVTDAIFSTQGR